MGRQRPVHACHVNTKRRPLGLAPGNVAEDCGALSQQTPALKVVAVAEALTCAPNAREPRRARREVCNWQDIPTVCIKKAIALCTGY